MQRLGLRRIVLDPMRREVYRVDVQDGFSGSRVLSFEQIPHFKVEIPSGRIDVVTRESDLRVERIDLPGVGRREAQEVGRRRLSERVDTGGEGADLVASSLVDTRDGDSAVWLVCGQADVCEAADLVLTMRGIHAQRLLPHRLALGALARFYPEPGQGELTGILWLDENHGTCVVADRFGNVVAATPSGWGGVMAGETGIQLGSPL